MFLDSPPYYILGPALIVIIFTSLIIHAKTNRKVGELHKAIAAMKLATIASGAVFLCLWFLLPQTPILSTFGFPNSVADIQSAEHLLQYFQDYNKALVRTISVLYWFLLVFVFWFLAATYSLTKALAKMADAQSGNSPTR